MGLEVIEVSVTLCQGRMGREVVNSNRNSPLSKGGREGILSCANKSLIGTEAMAKRRKALKSGHSSALLLARGGSKGQWGGQGVLSF